MRRTVTARRTFKRIGPPPGGTPEGNYPLGTIRAEGLDLDGQPVRVVGESKDKLTLTVELIGAHIPAPWESGDRLRVGVYEFAKE